VTIRCCVFGHEWLTVYQTLLPEQDEVTTIHVCHRCREQQKIVMEVPSENDGGDES